jgi:hypothetical protein
MNPYFEQHQTSIMPVSEYEAMLSFRNGSPRWVRILSPLVANKKHVGTFFALISFTFMAFASCMTVLDDGILFANSEVKAPVFFMQIAVYILSFLGIVLGICSELSNRAFVASMKR